MTLTENGLAILKLLYVNMRAEQISKYFVDNEIQVSLWKEYSNTNMERRKVRMNPAMLDWGHRLHTHKHTHTYTNRYRNIDLYYVWVNIYTYVSKFCPLKRSKSSEMP